MPGPSRPPSHTDLRAETHTGAPTGIADPFRQTAGGAQAKASVGRSVALMTLGLWSSSFMAATATAAVAGAEDQLQRAAVRLVVDIFGIAVCGALYQLLIRGPSRPFHRRVLMAVPLTAMAALITLVANMLAISWSGFAPPLTRQTLAENTYFLGVWFWFFLCWAALCLAIVYSAEVRAETAARAAAQVAVRDAQLRALRYQINPHFLFNALNSLSSLVMDRRTAEAETMISRLSGFLRFSLTEAGDDDVELASELRHQQLYLAIEQTRFPELEVDIYLEPGVERALVPALILQPLVENAVRHGPGGRQPKRIVIRAEGRGRRLVLTVSNARGGGGPAEGTGLGLKNVRDRLRLRYRDEFAMAAGADRSEMFEVRLALPLVMT